MTHETNLTEKLAQVTSKERIECVYLWESAAGPHVLRVGTLEPRTQSLEGTFDAGPGVSLLGFL